MFPAVVLAVSVYVLSHLIPPLPWAAGWKWLAAAGLLALWQYHLVLSRFFGSLASPEVPRAVIAGLGWAFGVLVLLAVFLLVRDLAAFCLWAARLFGGPASLRLAEPGWTAGICLAAAVLSGIGVRQAVRVPGVRAIEVALPGLPREMDGLTVVQLTDLHLSRLFPAAWARAVVEKTESLSPDLILVTGDLIDGSVEARAADVEPLRNLHAPLGVFAITGNHEYYSGEAAWMAKFRDLGLTVLANAHAAVSRNGDALYVAGLTDAAAARFGDPLPDLKRALAGVPAGAPVILMAHRPGDAAAAAAAGVGLQLSGHTHGGQILGLHLITRAANGGYVSGMYRVGGMHLYVSNGTGLWNGFPVRLGLPAEITRITLRTAAGSRPPYFTVSPR